MIIQCNFAQDRGPLSAQSCEEFLRVADACKGDYAGALPIHSHLQGLKDSGDDGFVRAAASREHILGGWSADGQDQVGAFQAGGYWFAQRPGGQATLIAEALCSIDDDQ